jgi:riboflavin-specific deaminase-like protein
MSDLWQVGWARRLLPDGAEDPEPIHGAWPLDGVPVHADRPYLGLNMVATVDGRIEQAGTAAGLGSPSDQYLMRVLRAGADAAMHGASTLRAERFTPIVPPELSRERERRGLPAQPMGIVVSGSGALPAEHPYFRSATPDWPRLVITSNPAARVLEGPGVEVWPADGSTLDLAAAMRLLAQRGIRRVLCEGGPTLNGSLLRLGLVDELFLTQAPRILGGGHAPRLVMGPLLPDVTLSVRSLYARHDELFLRYAIHQPPG